MRIGIFTGKQTGGGQTYVSEILAALSDLADESFHEFILLTPSKEGFERISPFVDAQKIKIVHLYEQPNPKKRKNSLSTRVILASQSRIRRALGIEETQKSRINRVDQAARDMRLQIIWYLDQLYSKIPDVPYVATIWDLLHRLQPYFPEAADNGIWENREQGLSRYLQRASIIIAGSERGKQEIEHFYQVPAERIRVLRFPTPSFAIDPPSVDNQQVLLKHDLEAGFLFYPAQFWAHKNHVNILHALNLLRRKHQLKLHIVFVGSDRGNKKYIEQIVENLNLEAQVHFLGFVPQEDIIGLYRSALALTFLTFNGPGGIPPLEAFALGCPVIASQLPGSKELYGEAAILADPTSPEEISEAILTLFHDAELRTRLRKKGRERALNWTSEDLVRGGFNILNEFEAIRRCWP